MASPKMRSLPAMKRQHLLAEFAGLKQACPSGVFVSLTPGEVSLWSGVIFVRKGPYATAVLRFQISFPDAYPALPPLVTFSTDMFHPLITPLTTYMYTTDIQDNGTVSATDDERLPPGGFSLRHGFPDWFGRGSRSRQTSGQHTHQQQAVMTPPRSTTSGAAGGGNSSSKGSTTSPGTANASASASASPPSSSRQQQQQQQQQARRKKRELPPSTYEVLRYIRSAFDDEAVLDAVPLEGAGNPGAWHAWRTHRRQAGKVFPGDEVSTASTGAGAGAGEGSGSAGGGSGDGGGDGDGDGGDGGSKSVGGGVSSSGGAAAAASALARRPGEWNWDGVWEERSKRNIATSLSEAVLYGNAGIADEVINFLNLDENEIEGVKANLLKTLGATTA